MQATSMTLSFFQLEIIVLEVYENNRKWLFLGVYKPPTVTRMILSF